MAKLSLTIGTMTVELAATDEQAAALVGAYADSLGAGGTTRQRAEEVLRGLVRHMRERGAGHVRATRLAETEAAVDVETGGMKWK